MMSFWGMDSLLCSHKTNLNKKRTIFLQVHSVYTSNACITPKNKNIQPRRMSSCLQRLPAAISIEAALAIPLFIFFVVNLMILILFFKEYSQVTSKLQQSARALALTSINTDGSAETVTLQEDIKIAPLIKEIGFDSANTTVKVIYRKWTGYNVSGSKGEINEDEYVYVTEYGSVYHRNRECKHLSVSIKIVSSNDIESLRNSNMEKYTMCEICKGSGTGILFITESGNKYHGSASCSGLKRNVKTVKLSEVEGMPACSGCGR